MIDSGATFSIFIPETTFGISAIDSLGTFSPHQR